MLPVLLIHAAGGAARNFGSVLRRLEGARAIDLPGHGRAGGEAPRTIAASAEIALAGAPEGPFIAAGHSMGGAVALTLATLAPDRVRGVVLIATGARLQMSRAVAEKARNDFEGFLAALQATGSPIMTIEALRQAGQETVARDLEACVPWDGLALAPRVKAPALLLAGERDRTTPPALVRELAAALPAGARVVVLPGAGHVLPVEKPDDVAREIEAFRREVDS
ncbi:MAG TPA: alpha/beta hydrolase [Planctomycetota bacterium]|nr:alpha/beta hydrolase [Planctomycetota bacterium]